VSINAYACIRTPNYYSTTSIKTSGVEYSYVFRLNDEWSHVFR